MIKHKIQFFKARIKNSGLQSQYSKNIRKQTRVDGTVCKSHPVKGLL